MNEIKDVYRANQRRGFVRLIPVFLVFLLAFALVAVDASAKSGEDDIKSLTKKHVVIKTPQGEIELRFFPKVAPNHVKNFIKLAEKGFYDGTIFHRVIPGFMIQGGDPNTKGRNVASYGTGGPGYSIDAEFNKKKHKRGILSMARSRDPNSAGSQFFIVVKDAPNLDNQYTVFGEVVRGMAVVDKIVNLPRNRRDLPHKRVTITMRVIEK